MLLNKSPARTPRRSRTLSESPSFSRARVSKSYKSYKVTRALLSPRTATLADAGRMVRRKDTATKDAYPADREEAAWQSIREASLSSVHLGETYNRLLGDENIKKLMTTYVGPLSYSFHPSFF